MWVVGLLSSEGVTGTNILLVVLLVSSISTVFVRFFSPDIRGKKHQRTREK